jgi:hypothetical protein
MAARREITGSWCGKVGRFLYFSGMSSSRCRQGFGRRFTGIERSQGMDTRTKIGVFASSALVCLAVLFAPVINAGETPISSRYAGTGWDTHVDGFVPDGNNVSLTTGTGKGTLGNFTIAITTEFRLADTVACPDGFPLKYALVYSAVVSTFPDQSQLFGIAESGWICATGEGQYYGEVSGVYVGGTGRFREATGDYVSKFNGQFLEPNLSFRSIEGDVEGTVGRR